MKQLRSTLDIPVTEPSLGIPSFIPQPEPQPQTTPIDATAAIAIQKTFEIRSKIMNAIIRRNYRFSLIELI